jgi:hypothetical protein
LVWTTHTILCLHSTAIRFHNLTISVWQCEFNSANQARQNCATWNWSCPLKPKMLGAWYNGKWLALAP